MRKADPKHFKNIQVDEANILNWKGLIVPVSWGILVDNTWGSDY